MNGKLLLCVLALVFLSGCVGGGNGSGDKEAIDFVPNEDVNGVFRVDTAILENQTTEEFANTLIDGDNPNYDEEIQAYLDPGDINEVVVFTSVPSYPVVSQNEDIGAAVVSAELTEDEVVSLIEQNATVEAGEYSGVPFYTVGSEGEFGEARTSYMAVLQEGVFSFGQEGPVRSTVDVAQGDTEALSGELREELERVRDGYINFAVEIPKKTPGESGDGQGQGQGSEPRFDAFQEISVVSGSYYAEGESVGISANLRAGNAEDAKEMADAVDGFVSLGTLRYGESVSAILENIETETDGPTVTVTYETTVDENRSVVSGSYYTEGETVAFSANLRAGNPGDAQEIGGAVDRLVSIGTGYGENASAVLDPLETETDESTVTVTYETTVDELVENAESLGQAMGPGAGPGEGFGGSSGGEGFGSSSGAGSGG